MREYQAAIALRAGDEGAGVAELKHGYALALRASGRNDEAERMECEASQSLHAPNNRGLSGAPAR
jgi:streptomycin 6-kinase